MSYRRIHDPTSQHHLGDVQFFISLKDQRVCVAKIKKALLDAMGCSNKSIMNVSVGCIK